MNNNNTLFFVIDNLENIKHALTSLEVLSANTDSDIPAHTISPLISQIRLNLDNELTILNNIKPSV